MHQWQQRPEKLGYVETETSKGDNISPENLRTIDKPYLDMVEYPTSRGRQMYLKKVKKKTNVIRGKNTRLGGLGQVNTRRSLGHFFMAYLLLSGLN